MRKKTRLKRIAAWLSLGFVVLAAVGVATYLQLGLRPFFIRSYRVEAKKYLPSFCLEQSALAQDPFAARPIAPAAMRVRS